MTLFLILKQITKRHPASPTPSHERRKTAQRALVIAALSLLSSCKPTETTITLHPGDLIVAEGDSLTYGQDFTGTGHGLQTPFNGSMNNRSNAPYPETLQKILDDKVTVENRGYPGDRTNEGMTRWADAKSGNLAIIGYGTNDCWNFNQYPSGKQTVEQFKTALKELVVRRQKDGAKIILLTPPPLQPPDWNAALPPYQQAVKQVAQELAVPVEDTAADLANVTSKWVDGVHLSLEANRKIAEALANKIDIEQ